MVCRQPSVDDGEPIHRVVRESGVLDVNSCYLYLLLSTEFRDTCVVAEREEDGRIMGFVTGFRPPAKAGTVFLWQVGVDEAARGQGLGRALVEAFLEAPGCREATTLETTISPSNEASQGLFRAVARGRDAEVSVHPYFDEQHFPPGHEAEELYRIRPLR